MAHYIDGFVLPIPQHRLNDYRSVVKQVAEIWLEYGALDYCEFVGDELNREGTGRFPEMMKTSDDESIIFGYVAFESKVARDKANEGVMNDPRMLSLIAPLIEPSELVFQPERMLFGGFRSLLHES